MLSYKTDIDDPGAMHCTASIIHLLTYYINRMHKYTRKEKEIKII